MLILHTSFFFTSVPNPYHHVATHWGRTPCLLTGIITIPLPQQREQSYSFSGHDYDIVRLPEQEGREAEDHKEILFVIGSVCID